MEAMGTIIDNAQKTPVVNNGAVGILLAKIGAMLVLGIGSLSVGSLPLCINRCRLSRGSASTAEGLLTSLLLCFGGGVLLFTSFVHLAPEVRESVEKLQESGKLMKLGGGLGLAELLLCGGFFFVYLVEEAVHAALDRKPEPTEAALHRSVSLRRCNRSSSGSRRSREAGRSGEKSLSTDARISPMAQDRAYESDTDNPGIFATRNSRLHQEVDSGYEKNGNLAGKVNGGSTCPCDASANPTRNSFGNTIPLSQNERSYLSRNLEVPRGLDGGEIEGKANPLCGNSSASSASTASPPASTLPPNASVRGLLTVIALSFHAIFEGLTVGLEPSMSSVIYLTAAIATHKLVIGFCVGMEMVAAGANARIVLGYLVVFSVVTPIGIGIGLVIGRLEDPGEGLGPLPTLLQGFAAGTLLYIVFFEVLARERANEKSGLLQLAAILVGFMFMLGLQYATSHSHEHGHGHSHGHSHEEETKNGDDDHLQNHDHRHHPDDLIASTISNVTEKILDVISTTLSSTMVTEKSA
ncbi:protein zntD isoform X1 [Neodiprion lecontei]|uniref:Protein zntD isoform X1 n=1 Tax=Neodiprion lecontei TaxID=441921 RepID=A0A6J0CDF5_NEOLC|nr:protein zntD isoform X1 [Neodiprion lecontei]XP_046587163.1 protein zntD isoform X1 [Neodiprion lecontei]XP_046587168.1 protein zntD isoform X1 [Neodiprion lecontei]XP_046587175.1 protein zntD isoform X1 [Neodiprion lecontei]XP_046587182.1 protein zntD isoform X1 [Neodiprion lecontei]